MSFKSILTQTFPPKPHFTESSLSDLSGKVYIVTGASAGVGKELTQKLYCKNAHVYMLARSADKTEKAIADIKNAFPTSKGALTFLRLNLADLASIRPTVEQFLTKERKLHVLFNNAGVLSSEETLVITPQGHEQHVGVNVLGGFLLAKLLTPLLASTAKVESPNTVRVIWVGSQASELYAIKDIGATAEMMSVDFLRKKSGVERYWRSKVGNWAHSVEYAMRHEADGIVSVGVNPGNLQSELYRDQGVMMRMGIKLMMYPPEDGACTELYAGLSPDITMSNTGCWVVPFGRIYPIREDLDKAKVLEAEGGTGATRKFWEWTEEQVKPYS
ncbi:hypothetical protein F4808DRAFT_472852 [Astrocystis sublimbata]|nr:hypothetical protein F4808DRAFT_472852 [Astrocystis sublimbata]